MFNRILREVKYLSMSVGICGIALIFLAFFALYILPLTEIAVAHAVEFLKHLKDISALTQNGI